MVLIASLNQALRKLKKCASNITLEPAIFMFMFGLSVLLGAGVSQKLMLWKVCHVVLHHNETICDNLTDPAHEEVENEVQIFTNTFQIKNGQLTSWPSVAYVIFAGALSDKYGRKYLIFMPIFGSLLSSVLDIVHYSFIRELPLEFYYLENLYALFGGTATYYMGIFAYGADITEPNNRALRYGLYDGMEMVGVFLGTIASPYIFELGGYYGVYIARLVFVSFALLYVLGFVKNKSEMVDSKALEAQGNKASLQKAVDANNNQICTWKTKVFFQLRQYLLAPVKEFFDSIAKKRPNNLRIILHVELFIYFLYEFTQSYATEIYIYMLKVG